MVNPVEERLRGGVLDRLMGAGGGHSSEISCVRHLKDEVEQTSGKMEEGVSGEGTARAKVLR